MSKRKIKAVDLFCGAGGTSTGLREACSALGLSLNLLAINHWDIAIATHSQNHPDAEHLCSTIEAVDPRKAVPSGKLDLLIASPECTHHSRARGGKPISDQSRASAWRIVEWCSTLRVENVLIENVPEFQTWAPLGSNGKPLKSRRGETYQAFLGALTSLGYSVEARVLNAANYGDPTSRERLFIQARRGRRRIEWPPLTHVREQGLFSAPKWRAAREIIDWSIPSQSIFKRKRPLSPNTMARIVAGLKRFGGLDFIVPAQSGGRPRGVHEPLPTITTRATGIGLCEPFLVKYHGNHKGRNDGASRLRAVSEPFPTLDTSNRLALCEPFIVPFFGERKGQAPRVHSINDPVPAVTSHGAGGLVQPFIVPVNHGNGDLRSHDIEKPMPTITSVDAWALIEPFLVSYYSNGHARSVDEPLDTVTSKDRFGLVEPQKIEARLDINFRMLQPHELAAAMSFPRDYEFKGNREQRVKQIGNAVPVRIAQALCESILREVA